MAEGMSAGLAWMASWNSCCSTMPSACSTSSASPTRWTGTSTRDDLVAPDDHEVDVGDRPPDRVALELAGHGQVARAVDVEGEEGVEPRLVGQGGPQLMAVDGHG